MEAKDEVISEVHLFTKDAKCFDVDYKGGKEMCVEENSNPKINQDSLKDKNHLEEKEEECAFTCRLGSNGQVILWSPMFETVLSRFEFTYPLSMPERHCKKNINLTIDDDGDLNVLRRKDLMEKDGVILVEHQSSTTLDLVGEQVWRGAFFLSDYILHNTEEFKDANVLEVASGVGLTSIVAAMLARKVIITDVDKGDIIDLIGRNVKRNSELCVADIFIKEIDFFDLQTISELGVLKDDVNVLIAADVIYHNQLTDAFIDATLNLMKQKPNKVMYIALEKRYVFTIDVMDRVAPCYEYFVTRLQWLKTQETSTVTWAIDQIDTLDLPQYFTYERTKDLVLWKIEAKVKS